jgi:hypothetical protein
MRRLPSGAFLADDGEILTLDIASTGAQTLFGVNFSLGGSGSAIPQGQPFQITLDKSKATGGSDIPGARSTVLTLTFSFSSKQGGRYEYTMSGDPAGDPPLNRRAVQAGKLPTVNTFIFHIV